MKLSESLYECSVGNTVALSKDELIGKAAHRIMRLEIVADMALQYINKTHSSDPDYSEAKKVIEALGRVLNSGA